LHCLRSGRTGLPVRHVALDFGPGLGVSLLTRATILGGVLSAGLAGEPLCDATEQGDHLVAVGEGPNQECAAKGLELFGIEIKASAEAPPPVE